MVSMFGTCARCWRAVATWAPIQPAGAATRGLPYSMQAAQSVLLIVADDMQPSDIHALRHLHAPPILAETPWQALEHVPIWKFEQADCFNLLLTQVICPAYRWQLVVVGQRSKRRAHSLQARARSPAAAARGPADRCSLTIPSLPACMRRGFVSVLRVCRRRHWIDWWRRESPCREPTRRSAPTQLESPNPDAQ